jgi:hypothetical protein
MKQESAVTVDHADVCFSNRPTRVKRFQTVHGSGVDVTRGLVLLYGIGTQGPSIMGSEDEAEQSLGRPCHRQVQADMRTHLIHRPARDTIPPLGGARVSSCRDLVLRRSHAAATSLVQRNSVPSTQMRCRITASRRASATIALLMPRCLAIFIAQALSQDHFVERNMLCAAS